MNIQFLLEAKDKGSISQKNKFKENLTDIFGTAKSSGLSNSVLKVIIDLALNVDLDDKTFQNLILCMIPKKKISKEIVSDVICWFCTHFGDSQLIEKLKPLVDWIACLLDHKMIEKEAVDPYYDALFGALQRNWRSLTYILYLLTKTEDVTRWRIHVIQECIEKYPNPSHFCALLKRFQELNPDFVYKNTPLRKTIEQVFFDENFFYKKVDFSRRSIVRSSSSSIMPFLNHKKLIEKNGEIIIPPLQYLDANIHPQILNECHVNDIINGIDLVKNFHKLTLPLNTLSLLNSTMGIYVLMMKNRFVHEHFLQNLCCLLKENLIFKRSNYSIAEVEDLLEKVVQLQQIFRQGFTSVSRVLRIFLQCWDGHQYRRQIYRILEWFVFKSKAELNRFLLLPIYTLFVSGQPDEQCDIIIYFTNFIKNLFLRMDRSAQNHTDIFEETNILQSRDDLISIIRQMTKFTSELCKMALYFYPCNNQILFTSIMFYEKIQELETLYEVRWWTVISSNVVYHCLFSFNVQLINQMCNLWLKYREMQMFFNDNQATRIEDKKDKLRKYANDMFNILWTGQAFSQRMQGHVFTGLSSEDELNWRQNVNLNNSLTLERHIMFSPYRMLHIEEGSCNVISKATMMKILLEYAPHFCNVLQRMIDSTEIDEADEDMEL